MNLENIKEDKEMDKSFKELRDRMLRAVRAEVAKIKGFTNGAIKFQFVVKSRESYDFLGYPSYEYELDVDVASVYSVKPNFPKTLYLENGDEVSCAGFAALKIEGCCHAVHYGTGRRSSDMPEEAVAPGRVREKGAVCFDIMCQKPPYLYEFLFLRVYVAVSGATGVEDERCALAAGPAIKEWAEGYSLGDMTVICPTKVSVQSILGDSSAATLKRTIAWKQCSSIYNTYKSLVHHFKKQVEISDFSPNKVAVAILSTSDPNGASMSESITPLFWHDWQLHHDDKTSFVYEIIEREDVTKWLQEIDSVAYEALINAEDLPVIVVDKGVATVHEM